VLGIPVPGTGGGINGLAKQVGKAGKEFKKASKQVGQLTDEVRAAREKAEQVGKVIS
jgi:Sec-independent protein translocase protein TatA